MRYDPRRGDEARSELRELLIELVGALDRPDPVLSGVVGTVAGPEVAHLLAALRARGDEIEQDGGAVLAVLDGIHERVLLADRLPLSWPAQERAREPGPAQT